MIQLSPVDIRESDKDAEKGKFLLHLAKHLMPAKAAATPGQQNYSTVSKTERIPHPVFICRHQRVIANQERLRIIQLIKG